MTEQLVGIVPIGDLTTIRVRCNKCLTVFEVGVDRLVDTFERQSCPKCGTLLVADREYQQFAHLQKALTRVSENALVDVEFVVKKSL
jgi:hypothetical protein